jgi:predicted polyphosphate/ATP-dependent NAD kinase
MRQAYRHPTAVSPLHGCILPLIASNLVGSMTPNPSISSLTAPRPFGYVRHTRASDPSACAPLCDRVGVRDDGRAPTSLSPRPSLPVRGRHGCLTMAQTGCVGCIANPMAGKDIRRLVAYGSRIDNQEKVNIVRRILLGLDSAGVAQALLMPDTFRIADKALEGLHQPLQLRMPVVEMEVRGDAKDTLQAAQHMCDAGAQCLLVLGGDGTHRVVAKACGLIPLVPISTGTNNVFPQMLEGTVAGLAAGFYVRYGPQLDGVILPTKRLEIWCDGTLQDIALVDVAVSAQQFVGARALWDVSGIQELFLTQGTPSNIGLSSIAGWSHPVTMTDAAGLHLVLGNDGRRVRAPIAPGLILPVGINHTRLIEPGERIPLRHAPAMLALDGERELLVRPGERWEVALSWEGPRVLDVERTLLLAQRQGLHRG